ncbi:MAG: biotin--[acetyl-CoA-carboxylase] ligase [Pusillimonas sp.]|nr:biotin--[acetyl-CoA-carboxylase] ligase [Pusillimonas sp.]
MSDLALPPPAQLQQTLEMALPEFRQVTWCEHTESTNADLLNEARTSQRTLARPWLLGAHFQRAGRGRSGRTWQNRAGANLMFSCAYDIFLPAHQLPTLSPLAGIAVAQALRNRLTPANRHRLTLKWPNDIWWDQAKLAGILVEVTRAGTAKHSQDHHVVIVGIGLNIQDARALSQSLNRAVADWSEVRSQDTRALTASAADLVANIAQSWRAIFNDITSSGFATLPEKYAKVDGLLGRHIHVIHNDRLLHAGIAKGINIMGQLIVSGPMGETPVSLGEISIRPRDASNQA